MQQDFDSFLRKNPDYSNPESSRFMDGMIRAKKYLPKNRITDYLFRRTRQRKLPKNLVYVLFREDDYISQHYDLCEKILRYVLDWISEVRQPYGHYSLPDKRFMMKYFKQVKRVLESQCPEEEDTFDAMSDMIMINREAIRVKDMKATRGLLLMLIKKKKKMEDYALLGDNLFDMLDDINAIFGMHDTLYLMQLCFYRKLRLAYDSSGELVREGIEPNPGPHCLACGRTYRHEMMKLCPSCCPENYQAYRFQSRTNKKKKKYDMVIKEASALRVTCRGCFTIMEGGFAWKKRYNKKKIDMYLWFVRLFRCFVCETLFQIVPATFLEGRDLKNYFENQNEVWARGIHSNDQTPLRLYQQRSQQLISSAATAAQEMTLSKLPWMFQIRKEFMGFYEDGSLLIHVAEMVFLINVEGRMYRSVRDSATVRLSYSIIDRDYEEVDDFEETFFQLHPDKSHRMYRFLLLQRNKADSEEYQALFFQCHSQKPNFDRRSLAVLSETQEFVISLSVQSCCSIQNVEVRGLSKEVMSRIGEVLL